LILKAVGYRDTGAPLTEAPDAPQGAGITYVEIDGRKNKGQTKFIGTSDKDKKE
jgi:hypothetical protein